MPRVKRGTTKTQKRKKLLSYAKGYRWGRKNQKRQATEAVLHAFQDKYRGRKEKKRTSRELWQTRLSAAVKAHTATETEKGMSYSGFMDKMKKKKSTLNRKVLSEIAVKNPETFKKILEEVT